MDNSAKKYIFVEKNKIMKIRLIYYWKTILAAIVILVVSLGSFSMRQNPDIPNLDKIIHIVIYAILSFCLFYDYGQNQNIKNNKHTLALVAIPIIYGGLMEVLQSLLTEDRMASLGDFLANISGTIIAWGIYHLIYQRKQ